MERNSAGRLLRCIKQFQQSKAYSLEALRVIFGVDAKNRQDLDRIKHAFIAMHELHVMYEEFINDMQENYPISKQKESILAGLESLNKWVYPTNIETGVPTLDVSVFALLDVCAKGLPEENEIPPSEFDQLREGLQTLRDLAKKVKPALRKVLLELIRISEDAIAKYEIRGAAGMKKSLKQMWGELAEIWRVETPDKEDEVERDTVLQAAKAFVMKFDNVFAKAVKYRPLLEYVLPALLNGPS